MQLQTVTIGFDSGKSLTIGRAYGSVMIVGSKVNVSIPAEDVNSSSDAFWRAVLHALRSVCGMRPKGVFSLDSGDEPLPANLSNSDIHDFADMVRRLA